MTYEFVTSYETQVEEFSGKLFRSCLATMELANIELGIRLGLYAPLAGAGGLTSAELSSRAGINERYASEWLEQQAVAGVVVVDDQDKPAALRRFALPDAHALVLLDDDSDACMKPAAAVAPWVAKAIAIMESEFKEGSGAPFGLFDLHDLQAAFTRPVFANHLCQSWLPAVPDIQAKLDAGDRVRIAEVGCGEGLAAIEIARRYAHAQIDGYDLDYASVKAARAAATIAGVSGRVRFDVRDASDSELRGNYDLVMAIEMLHDVRDPVGVLRSMKALAKDDGAVLIVDERTAEKFSVPASEMERLFYSFSTLHCLAVSMYENGAGTGTLIRPDTVRRYANEAGFANVEILDVEHPQFRLYRLS